MTDLVWDGTNVTFAVADFATRTRWDDLPPAVCHEAKRSLMNFMAAAIGGSREPPVTMALEVQRPFSGVADCTIIGRGDRTDMMLAAFLNAISANVFDFDDTHQATVIHPTAPVAPALFALSERRSVSGRDLLAAFIVGGEIECRVGNAVSPSHYTRGWHITSTCGIFGSALGAGRLLGLGVDRAVAAIANASAQAAGLVETLGTMSKSISVGNAARGGLLAVLLAERGYTGPDDVLNGPRGFLKVFADTVPAGGGTAALMDGLGSTWEIARNTYKPYPAGIVLHPVIEASLRLHHEHGLRAVDVLAVELTGHPLLQQRTDRPDVESGRLSQVSAQHAIAIALHRGSAGLDAFDDAAVAETGRNGLRPRVTFIDDPSRAIKSVGMIAWTRRGEAIAIDIAAAKGGPTRPMTDQELEDKLAELAAFRGYSGDVGAIADAIWTLDEATDASRVMRLAAAG